MALRPVDPITLSLAGGEEHQFLLTLGAIRRLKKRFEITSLKDLLNRDIEECAVPVLWEALTSKPEGMTEDQFADLLPASLEWEGKVIAMLFGASFPDEDKTARPLTASPLPSGTGSESVPSGQSDSTET